ncbi:MAG: mechanosensitive ion channel family protein [Ornithinimicrobium sp.]
MLASGPNPAAQPINLPDVTWQAVAVGVGALLAFVVVSWVVRWIVVGLLTWRKRGPSAVSVFGLLAQWLVILLGLGVALTIVFPSVRPVDVLGGLGVISIAAGIAFQTVLGNMFAGIMILSRGRFRVGDQIGVREVRGTVTGISLNSTTVRTFDGRQVLIPNQIMHSDMVTVQTGYERVRTSVEVQIDAAADPARARRIAIEAMQSVPAVSGDPLPQALLTTLDKGALTLELRFWSGARQLETREAQDAVIEAVLSAFVDTGVRLADEIQTIEAGPDVLAALTKARHEKIAEPHDIT